MKRECSSHRDLSSAATEQDISCLLYTSENVEAFTKRFEDFVSQHILPEQTSAVIDIDAEIDFRDITHRFLSLIHI